MFIVFVIAFPLAKAASASTFSRGIVDAADGISLMQARARLTDDHTTKRLPKKTCTAHDMSQGPISGSWKKKAMQTNWELCPFMKPNFNCIGRKTSASQWTFQPEMPQGCGVPEIEESLHALAGQRMLLCGDSHMRQVLVEVSCGFQDLLLQNHGHSAPFPPSDWLPISPLENFYPEEALKRWAADWANASGFAQQANQTSGQFLREHAKRYYTILQENNAELSVVKFKNGLQIWYLYVRGVAQPEQACLDVAHRLDKVSGNIDLGEKSPNTRWVVKADDLNQFDHIVVNEYIGIQDLVTKLAKVGYRQKLFLIPSWTEGLLTSVGPQPTKVDGLARRLGDSQFSNLTFPAYTLHLESAILSRQNDAYTGLFPIYVQRNGSYKPCPRASNISTTLKKCTSTYDQDIAYKPCASLPGESQACYDGHFCQPGPVEGFARLIFAALAGSVGA